MLHTHPDQRATMPDVISHSWMSLPNSDARAMSATPSPLPHFPSLSLPPHTDVDGAVPSGSPDAQPPPTSPPLPDRLPSASPPLLLSHLPQPRPRQSPGIALSQVRQSVLSAMKRVGSRDSPSSQQCYSAEGSPICSGVVAAEVSDDHGTTGVSGGAANPSSAPRRRGERVAGIVGTWSNPEEFLLHFAKQRHHARPPMFQLQSRRRVSCDSTVADVDTGDATDNESKHASITPTCTVLSTWCPAMCIPKLYGRYYRFLLGLLACKHVL
jgi:hypothetical protein